MITKLIFFLLIQFNAQAGSFLENKSVVCPDNNIVYKGVTCCLESISEEACKSKVDSLPPRVTEAIQSVLNLFDSGAYPYGRVPNCFWFAAMYKNLISYQPHKPIGDIELKEQLKLQGFSPTAQYKKDDLIIFEAQGLLREVKETESGPKRTWTHTEFTGHANIYIGNGLILQKEDIGTNVFSLSSLEQSIEAYEKAFVRNPQLRNVTINAHFWSNKNQNP